jgi:thiamine-phosphate pyrophosphorylase
MSRNVGIGKINRAMLYGILDMGYVIKSEMMCVVRGLLEGGVGVIQLRAKGYDAEGVTSLLHEYAPNLLPLCQSFEVPLIINDFPEVAHAIGADGVHIGQDDGSLVDVRSVISDSMIVGRSTHSPEQARAALAEGFDYIGFGPLFPTPTKKGRAGIGLESIAEVENDVGNEIPVFCIGGIKRDNLELVLASGARRVVIVSALLQAESIPAEASDVITCLST